MIILNLVWFIYMNVCVCIFLSKNKQTKNKQVKKKRNVPQTQ